VDLIFDNVSAIFHQLASEFGLSTSAEVKREAERWTHEYFAMSRDLQEDMELTTNSPSEAFWRRYTTRHLRILGAQEEGLETLTTQIMEKMDTVYQPKHWIPDDVLPTLEHLRDAGFIIGLVSNRRNPIGDLLLELGIENVFDFTLIAGDVGYWKPDPRLLEHALNLIGVFPNEAIYVGDNYYADVIGAKAAGLCPILLDPKDLFPGPGCPVIHSIGELRSLILINQDIQ
jgi:HAD superfamily hydrolase (TIGR01549 family)